MHTAIHLAFLGKSLQHRSITEKKQPTRLSLPLPSNDLPHEQTPPVDVTMLANRLYGIGRKISNRIPRRHTDGVVCPE